MRYSASAWSKWKIEKKLLDPEYFCNGLRKDCHLDIPIDVMRAVCDRYGGDLTLASFVKIMSDGANMGTHIQAGSNKSHMQNS